MNQAEFQSLMMMGAVAFQAINLITSKAGEMTPEQQAEADALVGRIKTAQAMVAPYEKETA